MLPTVIAGARRFLIHESLTLRHATKSSSGPWNCACQNVALPTRRVVLGARCFADVAGPNGPGSGQEQEVGRSGSTSSSGSSSSSATAEDIDASEALSNAKSAWSIVIHGKPEHQPPPISTFRRWLGKKVALHHVGSIIEGEDGTLDFEKDLIRGAPLCLRFLADESLDGTTFSKSTSSLKPPFIQEALGDRLREMMTTFRTAGCSWSWELLDIEEVTLQRLFVIVGGSRGGNLGTTGIMAAFGQQFVLSEEQTNRFLDKSSGLQGRMSVLQELMLSNMVLVGDVSLRVSQRSLLSCGEESTSSGKETAPVVVEHVLRLEMALDQVRNYDDDEGPLLRPSSWHVADWNWACIGNHPSLPRGVAAPW